MVCISPQKFSLSVEQDYIYRAFDYNKLASILVQNDTLKKSGIDIENTYEILKKSYQLNNEEVFGKIIKPDDFKKNHNKIDELLNLCNARVFVEITNIIIGNLDKDFDRFSIVSKRTANNFCERVIIQLLKSHLTEKDTNFIHKLLTDENISIDYNYYYADYFGQTRLKDMLAFSGNKTIIRDLLSISENIERTYWHGESKIQLYRLYAIIGEYEKSITLFQRNYNYSYDFTEDYNNGFNEEGFACGSVQYEDSLVEFIESVCCSLGDSNMDYLSKRNIIMNIFNSNNIQYINLDRTLPFLIDILNEEDIDLLLSTLMHNYDEGKVGFMVVEEQEQIYSRYIIRIACDEQIQESLRDFNYKGNKRKNKKYN